MVSTAPPNPHCIGR